jgi:segregation and condensation protein B
MAAPKNSRFLPSEAVPLSAIPDVDALANPSDDGLSLDELSQAYAALLAKGSDPYTPAAEEASESEPPLVQGPADPLPVIAGNDDASCEIAPRSILEAILFVGHPTGEPLTSERIAALMRGVRPAEIDELVAELNDLYAAEGAPYSIAAVGPGYQLVLRPEFAPLRDSFYGRIREARLSQAAIDILAIVAYHQPLPASEIDRLRGKPSGAILSQLVRRDLLAIEPAREGRGRHLYRTTSRFLSLFGLENLTELPRGQQSDSEL